MPDHHSAAPLQPMSSADEHAESFVFPRRRIARESFVSN
jgi:hypothetical protein